jgi:hypothetical protein
VRDFEKTVISQYWNSPVLTALITNFNTYLDPGANLDAFYNLIWNVDTAEGYGLDVWGRIVGIGRVLSVGVGSYFGWLEAGDRTGFNQSPFYNGQPATSNFALSDLAYRDLILAKAASNVSNCSIPAINRILMALFPNRGNAYVSDDGNMLLTYVFTFPLLPYEVSIVLNSGVLPKPTGVLARASYTLAV